MASRSEHRTSAARLRRLLGALVLTAAAAGAPPGAWAGKAASRVVASPGYPTGPVAEKTITVVNVYNYQESEYAPPYAITALPETVAGTASPEQTMLSRTSAMMHLDYERYLGYWDRSGRLVFEGRSRQARRTPESYLRQWKGIFGAMHMTMRRYIETGDYVIVTYQMIGPDGKPALQGLELPVVFREHDGRWLATQDLAVAGDDLLRVMPWAGGPSRVLIEVGQ